MPDARRLGSEAEDRAADYLLSLGWTIITRRWKPASGGEIDIVAQDGNTIVFVEVKERSGDLPPEDAMTSIKRERLRKAAEIYAGENGLEGRSMRHDLLAYHQGELRHWREAL